MADTDMADTHAPSPSPRPVSRDSYSPDPEPSISISVVHAGQTHTFDLPASGTVDDLTLECEEAWGPEYDWSSHKFIAPPPTGLLKAAEHSAVPLAALAGKKLRLMASKLKEVDALRAAGQSAKHLAERRRRQTRHPVRRRDQARTEEDTKYNFQAIRPLQGLPNPQRSLDYLNRLASDPGIRAAMRAHKFTVGLLTEMDPGTYTESTHEGTTRTLGLNRNSGEVIELRLRTDAYDGYRDYKTIRNTLCHELAHNVHGPHDRNFWDLCHQIEREVSRQDWKSGGRTVGTEPTYEPAVEGDEVDYGGLTSGEAVLGGSGSGSGSGSAGVASTGLTRRQILAKAAEERMRRMNEERRDTGNGEGAGK